MFDDICHFMVLAHLLKSNSMTCQWHCSRGTIGRKLTSRKFLKLFLFQKYKIGGCKSPFLREFRVKIGILSTAVSTVRNLQLVLGKL